MCLITLQSGYGRNITPMHADTGQFPDGLCPAFHHPPRSRISEKRAQQLVRQGVARADARVATQYRTSGKVKIAHRIQHLVAHRLICMAQATGA